MMKAFTMLMITTIWKKTPMLMLMSMIVCSTMTAGVVSMMTSNTWNCLLLVMVYVSGIMVLFMYITSLSPQEKNKVKPNNTMISLLFIITMGSGLYSNSNMISWSNSIKNSFQMNLGGLWALMCLLSMMATTLPVVSMNLNKGLKTSK